MSEGGKRRPLRVSVDPDALVAFPAHYTLEQSDEQTAEVVYWDTADLRVLRSGHLLAERRVGAADAATWTVSTGGPHAWSPDGVPRTFLTVDADVSVPPRGATDLLHGITGTAALGWVLRTTTITTRRRLRHQPSDSVAEVVDVVVTSVFAHEDVATERRLEVGPADGTEAVRGLRKWAHRLGERTDVDAAAEALADVDDDPAERPGRSSTLADLVSHAIASAAARLLAHDPAIRAAEDPEDVHQARVATRRLRADLKTLEPYCDAPRVEGLRNELRWLASLLGTVRDLDVLRDRWAPADAVVATDEGDTVDATHPGVVAVLRAIDDQRHVARLVLRDAMTSARYRNLVEDLERLRREPPLLRSGGTRGSAIKVLEKRVEHAYVRVLTAVRLVPDPAPPAALHEIRKRAKRARYAAELALPFAPERPTKLIGALTRLQDVLGARQDLALARAWLDGLDVATLSPEAAYGIGRLRADVDAELATLSEEWKPVWEKVRKHRRQTRLR